MRLALFDIDKTLIDHKGPSFERFYYAIKSVYNIDVKEINTHGMTDQQIITEVLKRSGLKETKIRSKMEECKQATIDYFRKRVKNIDYFILDGVEKLLEELEKNSVLIGLVTGNLEEIAKMKIKKVGLDRFFKLGGFGSDAISRIKLVKIAIRRAEENFDFEFDNNVFLVGDTPLDIKAGKDAGVITIGVASGVYSENDLKKSKADYVLSNLSDTKKMLNIIMK